MSTITSARSLVGPHSNRVEIRVDPVRGRCLHAVRAFQPLEVIVREPAHAFSLSPPALDRFCHSCVKPLPTSRKRCSVCKVTRYCSLECQQFHWPLHRLECPHLLDFFTLVDDVNESDTARLIFISRILLAHRFIKEQKSQGKLLKPILAEMEQTMALAESLATTGDMMDIEKKPLPESAKRLMSDHIVQYMTGQARRATEAEHGEVQLWARRLVTNSLAISAALNTSAIAAVVSLANHDCTPNAVQVPDGRFCHLAAKTSIAAGEEICISYISEAELLQPTAARQKELMTIYRFKCECDKCKGKPVKKQVDSPPAFFKPTASSPTLTMIHRKDL